MDRRKFIKRSAVGLGVAAVGCGVVYGLMRDDDPMSDFYKSTQKVLAGRFNEKRAAELTARIRHEYQSLLKTAPDIGGSENMFTEWLNYGVYCLAVYRVISPKFMLKEQTGRVVFDIFQDMADYPSWLLYLVGRIKYRAGYVDKLRRAAAQSQERRYPGDWVAKFVEGDGRDFDWGLDVIECGICKLYQAHGAAKFTPYVCLSDYVVSAAFNRGLVRQETLAEGGARCDFRYKKGRPTYVRPLRDGWPPKFGENG